MRKRVVCRSVVFFFQAEDGIRDVAVTGVQTCALPIFGATASSTAPVLRTLSRAPGPTDPTGKPFGLYVAKAAPAESSTSAYASAGSRRSEERRVGKEGRSRWSPYH